MLSVPSVFSNSPASGIAGRFLTIIDRLCRGLDQHAIRNWTATAFVQIIVHSLRRRAERFVGLKARFDAGVPAPLPRPMRARIPADGAMSERAFDFLPRTRGWLKTTTEQDGAAAFWQLRDLLAEPEMAALLAADPRVGRLLRPLWWMLSPKLGLPEVLRPPPRQPASSPADGAARRPPGHPAPPPTSPRRPAMRVVRIRAVPRSGSGPLVPA